MNKKGKEIRSLDQIIERQQAGFDLSSRSQWIDFKTGFIL